jgi:hypothetical protein
MDLAKALENLKLDNRMKEWNLKQGVLNKEDLVKYVGGLKDSAADCEEVTLEDLGDFED